MKQQLSKALFTLAFVSYLAIAGNAQVRAIYDRGSAGLGQQLKRILTNASVMHTGAHPDDEDSGLMAYLARRDSARTAYLALNRGDGGQNVIGDELFESLGVIRSEELLQARRLDGGEQLFTRVMDYGFSKQRKEAAGIWGEQLVLADMVRAIRLFKPLVIISRFSGTPRDGHGQHQLAGYLTPLAYKAAADPNMFPEQIKEGLEPWAAIKLYRSGGFRPDPNDPPSLQIVTGTIDPLIGRSYFEVAMEGRSQHKSQEMGALELRGDFKSDLKLLDSSLKTPAKENGIFDGIDTTLSGFASLIPGAPENYRTELQAAENAANEASVNYNQSRPREILPMLLNGYKHAQNAEKASSIPLAKQYARRKMNEFASAIRMASGITIDALASSEIVNPGKPVDVAVRFFAPADQDVTVGQISIEGEGWKSETAAKPKAGAQGFSFREDIPRSETNFVVTAPENAKPTAPYWLEKPRNSNYTFDWGDAGDAKNRPFASPLLLAKTKIKFGDDEIEYSQPVEYRYADDIRGEIRRELNVVPQVTLGLDSNLIVAPSSKSASKYDVVVTVENNSPNESKGEVRLELPKGWQSNPNTSTFDLKRVGDSTALSFSVAVPGGLPDGQYKIQAVAEIDGKRFDKEMTTVAYPHIQTHRIYRPAELNFELFDLKVAPVKVGYVMGSGDRVPEAIKRLGLSVTMLDKRELSVGDLDRFDTIVIGVRASQVRPDFVANNQRVLDFVRNGGTLIVEYQQQEYVRLGLEPYPAKMDGNSRVVDENAKVTILAPNNPVFNFPNKITDADFEHWVQERNLYSFTEWSKDYTPLLESHDEGEPEQKGGMLYAKLGKGVYIYSSYSWFRQLPKGTPGAYRIFANMLSQPKAPKN